MAYSISHSQTNYYHESAEKKSALILFFAWCANQDAENHIGWVGASITMMSAIVFPLTMGIIMLNGAVFGLIAAAMAALVLVVVTNLAAMSTKYTIPFFFLGILIDLVVIFASFFVS
ncbi:MAG TPA: hypothetical protein VMH01_13600 [Puia sp.]|nr:hypothetical protein [Puia sp.]